MYAKELTIPMKEELINEGFKDLISVEEVSDLMENNKDTILLVINSVCGCAANSARPAIKQALRKTRYTPSVLATVFAGVDIEATEKAREYLLPYPPSSPSIALFKKGEIVHFIERHHIEGNTTKYISMHLMAVLEEYCK